LLPVKRAVTVLAILGHLVVVASLLHQPLGVHERAGVPRFLGWRLYHDSVRVWGPGADFFAVYHAGVNARASISIYRQHELFGGVTPYYYEYRYLPVLAHTLGRLLTLLPPLPAYRAWLLGTEAVFWILLLTVFQPLRPTPAGLVAWLALILSTPLFLELHMGQFTFMAVALFVMGVRIASRRDGRPSHVAWRFLTSAGLVTLSIVLKVFPAVTLIAWTRRRQCWPGRMR
jgi:hypothetical protein